MKNFILALLIGSAFFACVGDVGSVLTGDQANRLLSADTFKIWYRTARSTDGVSQSLNSCANSESRLFANLVGGLDTLLVFRCPRGADSVLVDSLNYEIGTDLDGDFNFQIDLIKGDSIYQTYDVLDLTSQYLRIRFQEDEVEIEETYQLEFDQ